MSETGSTAEFEGIFDHCAAITSSIELNDVVKTTLAAVQELLPCDQVVITLVEDGLIKVLAAEPAVSLAIMENGLAIGRGLVGRAVADRTAIYSPDITVDPRVEQTRDRWDTDDRSVVAVPFALGDEVIGALHAISSQVDAFSEQHRARLLALGPAVAVAMRRALTFQAERQSWDHRRKLDRQKSTFMRVAADDLEQPLADISDLVGQIKGRRKDELEGLAKELFERSQQLALLVEQVLELSLRDSADLDQVAN